MTTNATNLQKVLIYQVNNKKKILKHADHCPFWPNKIYLKMYEFRNLFILFVDQIVNLRFHSQQNAPYPMLLM